MQAAKREGKSLTQYSRSRGLSRYTLYAARQMLRSGSIQPILSTMLPIDRILSVSIHRVTTIISSLALCSRIYPAGRFQSSVCSKLATAGGYEYPLYRRLL